MFACISFSFFTDTLLVWCMLVGGLSDEIKKLACIGKVTKTFVFTSGTRAVLIMLISPGFLVFVNV
jgi:hypothetical protein